MMTLRQSLIETMARAWIEYEGDDWDALGSQQGKIKEVIAVELDAALNFLFVNAVEWSVSKEDRFMTADQYRASSDGEAHAFGLLAVLQDDQTTRETEVTSPLTPGSVHEQAET